MTPAHTRVSLHGLRRAEYNARIGVTVGSPENGRQAVRLAPGEEPISLKSENITDLPTPSIGLVIVGVEEGAGLALLRLIVESREAHLLSRGCYLPILALVNRGGAVNADRRPDATSPLPTDGAPHGGLRDDVIASVLGTDGDLSRCPGFISSKGNYRRLGPALNAAAYPSMVVVDASEGGYGAKHLTSSDAFRLERYGGACVAPGPGQNSSAEETLQRVFSAFTGWIPPLVPPPPSKRFLRCSWCGTLPTAPSVCSGCEAVCYCSSRCQLFELRDTRQLSHAAYCSHLKRHMKTDVRVSLPTAPSWLDITMCHSGHATGECELLRRIGHHCAPYDLFCPCVPDMDPVARPIEWRLELMAEVSLPPAI